MRTPRRRIFMPDRIGTALDGIGIRGSARTRSFRATEFSTAHLAGDFTRRSTPGGRPSVGDMDSGTVDTTDTSVTTSIMTITLGGLVSITILAFAVAGSPRVAARRAFTVVVKASEAEAAAVDSMVVVAASMEEVAVSGEAVTAGKMLSQRSKS
jgi:hypothetical protein